MRHLAHLLDRSLFYYCSGKDPTPVLIFGARIPLYVYADHLKACRSTPREEMAVLYRRLEEGGFSRTETRPVATPFKAAELTAWQTEDGEVFSLLYLAADATAAYFELYGEDTLPRCICNYRYEMNNARLGPIEEKVAYILGHCHTGRHLPIAEYPYRGDYSFGKDTRITLYLHDEYDEEL